MRAVSTAMLENSALYMDTTEQVPKIGLQQVHETVSDQTCQKYLHSTKELRKKDFRGLAPRDLVVLYSLTGTSGE